MNKKTYSFLETLAELDGGVFADKLTVAMRETAAGVIQNAGTGKVTLEFTLKQIGTTTQVHLAHKLKFDKPTHNGKQTEEATTSTPLWVSKNSLTLMPDNQEKFEFSD